jgi:NADH:ubiquinone oxidoreductase subunit E
MKKKLTTVAFMGTDEQLARLDEVIEKHRGEKGPMMPILQEAQEIYGYLPYEVQRHIALKTGTALEEIYGIATFYSQFKLNPSGQVAISVCLGTACYVKGSGDVIAEVSKELGVEIGSVSADGKFSLEATRCVGACGLAPVMVVNNEVYGKMTKEQVAGVLAKYKA